MKILFNIFLIFLLLTAFVPPFRRLIFHLLVGRQLVKEQRRQERARQQAQREGSIRVDVNPNANKSRFSGGEYVDYEDVK
ncbi:DUF4834 domain-containing protein [Arundinibacter roseus]|uniref:DUF4834 domain-containing protein n=1 Tax=Arundinibacter roseus TaxID=2070510 RepID=A0A4R4KLR2_9BACT|nr:DUF4834 domain-containing protein [Arundinibacter roseus]TDB67882.1 DUF4834 domain-containing protein [Arundinibacter roseus]